MSSIVSRVQQSNVKLRRLLRPDVEDTAILQNVGKYFPSDKMSHPRVVMCVCVAFVVGTSSLQLLEISLPYGGWNIHILVIL